MPPREDVRAYMLLLLNRTSWVVSEDGVYDTTRSARMNVTKPFTITNMIGSRESAIVEPSRSVLIIIDMQSAFPNPMTSRPLRRLTGLAQTTSSTRRSHRMQTRAGPLSTRLLTWSTLSEMPISR